MQSNPFFEIMNGHPDAKLIDIVENRRNDYQAEALTAAEAVLAKRNISWTAKQEIKEQEELTIESIQEEIAARLSEGEQIDHIRQDLKLRGVNVHEYAEQEQVIAEQTDPDFATRRARGGMYAGAILMPVLLLIYSGRIVRKEDDLIMLVLLSCMGSVVLLIAGYFYKRKK